MSLTPPGPRSGRQLSLFGVEAADPGPLDLAGLLAGPGQVVRMGGTARVSIVVDAPWRVHVLVAEFALRGLAATWVPTVDSHLGVRTSYASSLAPLGDGWLRGAVKRPPAGFHLDGPRLRLWVAAAGTPGSLGFLLRLGPSDEQCWDAVGAALAAVGLPAALVGPRAHRAESPRAHRAESPRAHRAESPRAHRADGPRAKGDPAGTADEPPGEPPDEPGEPPQGPDGRPQGPDATALITGPAYRITGRRRLARLAELVGERPSAAPSDAWPG